MKKTIMILGLGALLFAIPPLLLAHGGEDHSTHKLSPEQAQVEANYQAPALSEFPSLHPLVVHFPIVFLLIAPFVWMAGLWRKQEPLLKLAWVFGILGLATAYLAAEWIHPHTEGLSALADAALDRHDFWADMTLSMAFASSLLMSARIWIKRYQKTAALLALAFALSAMFSVSRAGHFGAALTHVYGIGPQGQNLETDKEHKP